MTRPVFHSTIRQKEITYAWDHSNNLVNYVDITIRNTHLVCGRPLGAYTLSHSLAAISSAARVLIPLKRTNRSEPLITTSTWIGLFMCSHMSILLLLIWSKAEKDVTPLNSFIKKAIKLFQVLGYCALQSIDRAFFSCDVDTKCWKKRKGTFTQWLMFYLDLWDKIVQNVVVYRVMSLNC